MKKYNLEAAEKTLAAYETSTDYDRLHELAKQGYKIPCFSSGQICLPTATPCFSVWQVAS